MRGTLAGAVFLVSTSLFAQTPSADVIAQLYINSGANGATSFRAHAGQRALFTAVLQNRGPFTAASAELAVSVPGTITHFYAGDPRINCTGGFNPLRCFTGDVEPDGIRFVQLETILPLGSGSYPSTAATLSITPDPDLLNNAVSRTVEVSEAPD